jgi:hypothetical protein
MLKEIKIFLNDKHERKVVLDINNPTNSKFVCHFSADELRIGPNHVSFDFDGEGLPSDLGCFASLRYMVERDDLREINNGLSVSTSYSKPLDKFTAGDEITVTVKVDAAKDYDYLIICSPIPAGASVVRGSDEGVTAAFEERFDKAILFVSRMKAGGHLYRYRIRCDYPGKYSVLPPSAALMYNTNINGGGTSKIVEIRQ